MENQIQILILNEQNEILSSSHFDEMPGDQFINHLINLDNGYKAQIYEIEYPSELSKLICEFY